MRYFFYAYEGYTESSNKDSVGSGIITVHNNNLEELYGFVSDEALIIAKTRSNRVHTIVLTALNEIVASK